MSPGRVASVARRIALGFRRDHRSLGLLLVAPLVVLSLVGAVWGSTAVVVPTVGVAADRFALPAGLGPRVVDAIVASPSIAGRRTTYDEAVRQVRDGALDAALWLDGAKLHILIEGSDPLRTGGVATAVQKAFADALAQSGIAAAASLLGAGVEIQQVYGGPGYTILDYVAPVLVGFFAFFFIFLLSTVSFLRERTSGTLERLMATPLRRGELVVGYLAGFGFFALVQAVVILLFTVLVLRVQYRGNLATIFLVEAALVVGAVSLGLLVSAAARNELQAVQFVPVVLLPQVFLSGLLIPVGQLPEYLRPVSAILPLTYANEALKAVMIKGAPLDDPLVLRDIAILVVFAAAAATAAVASIRREVA